MSEDRTSSVVSDTLIGTELDDLTVVIVTLIGGAALHAIQAALRGSVASVVTIDAAGSCFDAAGAVLGHSGVRNVPGRRREALRHVYTPFVAFVEDTVVPGDSWLSSITASLGPKGIAATGGPMTISPTLPWRYQALGLTEYARFHDRNFGRLSDISSRPGAVTALSGANFAFRTECLRAVMSPDGDGLIDNEVFSELRKGGHALIYEPAMAVNYAYAHISDAMLRSRFDHGRIYASRLYEGAGTGQRLFGAFKTLFLPAVLFVRTFKEAWRSQQLNWGAMMWIAVMHLYWSAGEFFGIAVGDDNGVERWT
ncbi:hypothetical protein BH09PSE3_BH09PSE3_00300 [soil metagenome]